MAPGNVETQERPMATWPSVHIGASKKTTECDRIVAALVSKLTPNRGSVLDIGAGLGNALSLIRDASNETVLHAADISPECLDRIRARVPSVEVHAIDETLGSLLALGRARFDCCLMAHVLEHTRQPIDVLHTALELVRPGGHLVVAVPNPASPLAVVASLLRYHYVNRGHVYCWDRSHWINFLENIGWVSDGSRALAQGALALQASRLPDSKPSEKRCSDS